MLERFGLGDLVSRLLGGQVNSLFNILTKSYTLHSEFDTFGWWLEEVGNEACSLAIHRNDLCSLTRLAEHI